MGLTVVLGGYHLQLSRLPYMCSAVRQISFRILVVGAIQTSAWVHCVHSSDVNFWVPLPAPACDPNIGSRSGTTQPAPWHRDELEPVR